MQIGLIVNNVDNALGPNNRLCIWTIGCFKKCKNCMSPKFRIFDESKNIDIIAEMEKYDFKNLTGEQQSQLFCEHPQFAEQCDWEKLIGGSRMNFCVCSRNLKNNIRFFLENKIQLSLHKSETPIYL